MLKTALKSNVLGIQQRKHYISILLRCHWPDDVLRLNEIAATEAPFNSYCNSTKVKVLAQNLKGS